MRMFNPISNELSWPRRVLSSDRMGDVFEDFDRIIDNFLRPTYANSINFQPRCDINEAKDHYLVSFDMPGVKKEDIKIEIHGSQLIISGERQREVKKDDEEAILRHEIMYGRFERSFTLPATIAADRIEAHYENGVLNVALPKAEEAKGRTIQIQTDSGGFLKKFLGTKKDSHKEYKDVKIS